LKEVICRGSNRVTSDDFNGRSNKETETETKKTRKA